MPKFTCKYDFSDIDAAFNSFNHEVRTKVDSVGKEAVDYAKENGDYQNQTGRLRRSTRYEVTDDNSLKIINDAPYAAEVEAKGYDVIGMASLFAEEHLKEIFE